MRYRFMRVLVMFDLPTLTSRDKKEYRDFRKFLITSGFIMMQESIYSKLALNTTNVDTIIKNINKKAPAEGIVQVLTITERQFLNMKFIVGEKSGDVIDSDERFVVL